MQTGAVSLGRNLKMHPRGSTNGYFSSPSSHPLYILPKYIVFFCKIGPFPDNEEVQIRKPLPEEELEKLPGFKYVYDSDTSLSEMIGESGEEEDDADDESEDEKLN